MKNLFHLLLVFGGLCPNLLLAQPYSYEKNFKQGLSLFQEGNYRSAIVEFSIAVEIEPRKEGFMYLAEAKQKIQDWEGALRVYENLIGIDSTDAVVFNNQGNLFDLLQKPEAALRAYDQALALDPAYTEAKYNRAITYFNVQDYNRARRDFEKVLEANPEDWEAMLGLALTEYRLGDTGRACAYLIKAKEGGLALAQKYLEEYCETQN
ncbi:MAG: tetratricopeptide repeat protein [Microscillaceae bacterium]|nr:tetratricopeptide repeat protein [Microscillaceae bacterium]